jgi:5-methylcytosine-specific restriction endonuclease McrA
MSLLNSPTLVLNKLWVPVSVESVKESITKAFSGIANFIDEETYQIYNWENWVDAFSLSREEDSLSSKYKFISTVSMFIRIPEIILLKKYSKIPKVEIKLTRRNLLIRDNFRCFYTGEKVTSKTATIDHVIPKSKGGKTVWTNVVICSFDANIRKADKTLEEAGLKLRKKPEKPIWNPLYTFSNPRRPKSWDKFIDTDKWNEIGYWDVELVD